LVFSIKNAKPDRTSGKVEDAFMKASTSVTRQSFQDTFQNLKKGF
jgi:hypothetical protein